MRENVTMYLGKVLAMPCPVCGGFCAGLGGLAGLCAADSDWPAGQGPCVLRNVCNDGLRKGKRCSATPPRGAPTDFGTVSTDCPPSPGQNISGSGQDIALAPFTTSVTTLAASTPCAGFKICTGNRTACSGDSDCPARRTCMGICSGSLEPCGASSSCPGTETCDRKCAGNGEECADAGECPSGQLCVAPVRCFAGGQWGPNPCNSACIGGPDDGAPCGMESECSSGECRPRVCRPDPGDPDNLPLKECSVSRKPCGATSDCPGGETCDALLPTEGACIAGPGYRQCFTNPIVRRGIPDPAKPVKVAVFTVLGTGSQAIDLSVGLPGPGAGCSHPAWSLRPGGQAETAGSAVTGSAAFREAFASVAERAGKISGCQNARN